MADTLRTSTRRRQGAAYSIQDTQDAPPEPQRVSLPIHHSYAPFSPALQSPLASVSRINGNGPPTTKFIPPQRSPFHPSRNTFGESVDESVDSFYPSPSPNTRISDSTTTTTTNSTTNPNQLEMSSSRTCAKPTSNSFIQTIVGSSSSGPNYEGTILSVDDSGSRTTPSVVPLIPPLDNNYTNNSANSGPGSLPTSCMNNMPYPSESSASSSSTTTCSTISSASTTTTLTVPKRSSSSSDRVRSVSATSSPSFAASRAFASSRQLRKPTTNMNMNIADALDVSNERSIATASIAYPPKAPALQNATTPTNTTSLMSTASSASSSISGTGSLLSSQTGQSSVFISPVRSFSFQDDLPSSNVNYSPKHSQQSVNFSRNTKNLSLNIVHDHHQQHKHHLSHFQHLNYDQPTDAQALEESYQPQQSTAVGSQYPRRSLSLLIPDHHQSTTDTNATSIAITKHSNTMNDENHTKHNINHFNDTLRAISNDNNNNNGVDQINQTVLEAQDPKDSTSGNQTLTTTTTITTTTTSDGLTTTVATTTSKINDSKFDKPSVNSDDNTSTSDSTHSLLDSRPHQSDDLDMHEETFSDEIVPQFSHMLLLLGKSRFGFPEELQESSQLDAYPLGPRNVLNDSIFLYGDPQVSKVAVDINQYDLVINVARECKNLLDEFDTADNTKEYLFVPWSHTSLILKELPFLTQKISEYQARGKKILVHCQCGVSRSACVIVAYFMKQFHLLVNEAYELLKNGSDSDTGRSAKLSPYHINACERICPNMSLIFELMDFNEVLQGQMTSSSGTD